MKIRIDEKVHASVERVFQTFADVEEAQERISGISKLEILSETRSGKGLRWRETRRMMGQDATEEMEITAFDAPHHYRVEAHSHGTHYQTDIDFTPDGDGTKVTWVFEGRAQTLPAKLMSLVGFLAIAVLLLCPPIEDTETDE